MTNSVRLLTLAFILAAAPGAALAQTHDHGGHSSHCGAGAQSVSSNSPDALHTTTGTIKELDAAGGRLVIDHGPVVSLNWPPMVMGFMADDAGLLNGLASGDKVRFDFRADPRGYLIVDIEKL
ncbi:MAG: copper-binding protein [Candidatus Adiutrix sp.]|jgi:Cu/Ag efflux protein CusF|nr:copper-binding protein [Candidatus Adiutrix sp.]